MSRTFHPRRQAPRIICALLLALSAAIGIFAPAAEAGAASPAAAVGQIVKVPPGQHEVALTFGADAWPGSINTILKTLKKHNVKLTFFLTGGYLTNFPANARAIANAGQEIASHGYRHWDFRTKSSATIAASFDQWEATLKQVTGKTGPMFWRAPYGYSDNRVRQIAADQGYQTIYWTLDALDTVGATKSRQFILNRILNTSWINLDGAIILMHVNAAGTVSALDEILTTLERRGIKAVTVSELLDRN